MSRLGFCWKTFFRRRGPNYGATLVNQYKLTLYISQERIQTSIQWEFNSPYKGMPFITWHSWCYNYMSCTSTFALVSSVSDPSMLLLLSCVDVCFIMFVILPRQSVKWWLCYLSYIVDSCNSNLCYSNFSIIRTNSKFKKLL